MGGGRLELKRQSGGRKGGKLQLAALDAEKLRIAGHQVQAVEGLGLEVAVIGPEQRRGKAQLAIEDIALQPDFVIRIPFGVDFEIVEVWKASKVAPSRLEPPRHAGIEVEILLKAVARTIAVSGKSVRDSVDLGGSCILNKKHHLKSKKKT